MKLETKKSSYARLPDPKKPETMHFNGVIQLTRSQTRMVADTLEPLVKELGGREKASLALTSSSARFRATA